MDDEFEIRERNARTVMRLLGEAEREVIPLYAQELFIGFLLNGLTNLEKHEVIAVMTLIVIESEGECGLDESISEYRVFDKNEVNIFSETFVVRRMCLEKLRGEIVKIDGKSMESVVEATQKLDQTTSRTAVENFLRALQSQPET
jgi:hypothetical protein